MTDLKLYNTLTRQKEVFVPIDPDNVRMYVCGPTVYDFAHIGNARPVIVFDVLFRLLRHLYDEDKVTYVRNITDVDDKINARALRDYPNLPLNEAIRNVTEKTANQFHEDVRALGCLEPTKEPRATEHIEGMVSMIQTLLDKDHAYLVQGEQGREVLFRVQSMRQYGQLSNRKLEDQQAGARIAVEAHKENAGDFVLWKESGENEPGWEGVFNGEMIHGRPGWHIECSVMSKHHLGETFDIHGGGLDLIFPHHENEIAQSCCAHGTDKMANIWMHNGYLQVEGKKMSKSDGNFVTIYDLLHTEKFGGRKWPGEVLRLAMLMTHYREPIDFSVKRLEEAAAITHQLHALGSTSLEAGNPSDEFVKLLADDFNTAAAIQHLYKRLSGIKDQGAEFCRTLKADGQLLGTLLLSSEEWEGKLRSSADVSEDQIDAKVKQRLECLNAKNFAEADQIRDELLAQGIQLKDSKDSETGERVTTWEVKR
ncbi:MAG: cysteine--tRNA ligase [Pseudomonadota bacterium]